MRIALYIGALLGLTLLVVLVVRVDIGAMLHTLLLGGWSLLWLVPYRTLFFLLYALGWSALLRAYNRDRRVGLGYLFWVTTVREAIDRLLPVASVGGGVAAVRLLRWRGLPAAQSGASVIVEALLTLFAVYVFSILGGLLLLDRDPSGLEQHRDLVLALLFSLPVPLLTAVLLRYGSIFRRFQSILVALLGVSPTTDGAASLDREVRASLRRTHTLVVAGSLQFAALLSGAFEVWFVLRLFGHPVDSKAALMLESLTQAVRHLAFLIPAGLGVQEAGLMLFGRTLGLDAELALAVSMAKRLREITWGVMSLLSWQWKEGRRVHRQRARS